MASTFHLRTQTDVLRQVDPNVLVFKAPPPCAHWVLANEWTKECYRIASLVSVTFGWAEAIFRKRSALNFKVHALYLKTAFPLTNHQLDPAVLWRPKLNRVTNRIYSNDPDCSGWLYTLVGLKYTA